MSVGKDINVPSKDLISRQGMLNSLNKHRIAKMIEGKDVTLVWECIDKVLQEPSAQPEPTFEQIKEYCERRCMTIITNYLYHDLTTAYSAQSERKKGRWINAECKDGTTAHKCSECKTLVGYSVSSLTWFNFCPWCGAEMRGEECTKVQ